MSLNGTPPPFPFLPLVCSLDVGKVLFQPQNLAKSRLGQGHCLNISPGGIYETILSWWGE